MAGQAGDGAPAQDGEGDQPEINITAPHGLEVDPRIYRDTDSLLTHGFLTASAEVNGVRFVFKSLNHHEFELLRLSTGDEKYKSDESENLFLSYCVFMVGIHNVLVDREEWLSQLVDTFAEFPARARSKLIRQLSGLNRRVSSASTLVEAYAMESDSRYRWTQLRGMDLSSPAATGIRGTEGLGLCWCQLTWRALNHYEDQHLATEREWENAKFIGGCTAGKGISKVYRQDEQRHEQEKNERQARKEKVIRMAILGKDMAEKVHPGMLVQVARTVEELAEQLQADLRGEKDFHDLVVDAEEKRVRDLVQQRQLAVQGVIDTHADEYGDQYVITNTNPAYEPMTRGEAEIRVSRGRQLAAQGVAQRFVSPEYSDPQRAEFMSKWGLIPKPDR